MREAPSHSLWDHFPPTATEKIISNFTKVACTGAVIGGTLGYFAGNIAAGIGTGIALGIAPISGFYLGQIIGATWNLQGDRATANAKVSVLENINGRAYTAAAIPTCYAIAYFYPQLRAAMLLSAGTISTLSAVSNGITYAYNNIPVKTEATIVPTAESVLASDGNAVPMPVGTEATNIPTVEAVANPDVRAETRTPPNSSLLGNASCSRLQIAQARHVAARHT